CSAPALPICHVAAAAPAGASLRGLWTQTHPPTPLHPTNSIPQPRRHCLTDEEFDACWAIYSTSQILISELHKGMNVLVDSDLVPEPQITDAALQACRQRNDLLVVNPMDGLPKDLFIMLLDCKQPRRNTDDNILPYLNKFSFIEYQTM
uniref:Cytochrome c oxidase subunit 5A, mitochondrial n=1 Tax=Lynx canadensis TaxID=61383 RepID=A0A667HK35_LYNCA